MHKHIHLTPWLQNTREHTLYTPTPRLPRAILCLLILCFDSFEEKVGTVSLGFFKRHWSHHDWEVTVCRVTWISPLELHLIKWPGTPSLGRERPLQTIAFPGVLLGNDGHVWWYTLSAKKCPSTKTSVPENTRLLGRENSLRQMCN